MAGCFRQTVCRETDVPGHATRLCDHTTHRIHAPSIKGATRMKTATPIRAMGIDCGTEFTGFAIIEKQGKALVRIASGSIALRKSQTFAERLDHIHRTLCAAILEHQPECVAVEE